MNTRLHMLVWHGIAASVWCRFPKGGTLVTDVWHEGVACLDWGCSWFLIMCKPLNSASSHGLGRPVWAAEVCVAVPRLMKARGCVAEWHHRVLLKSFYATTILPK